MQTTRPELQVYLDNPDLFILRYFSQNIHALENFHIRLITNSLTERRSLILYPAEHGKCLSKDTNVLMKDGTLRFAGDIKTGDKLSSGTCVASESNGTKDTLKITLRTGHEIVCTKNHPFFIDGNWVDAEKLEVGNEVILCENVVGLEEKRISNEEARLLGYFIGDGCVSSGNCNITTEDEEVLTDFYYCALYLGFDKGRVSKNSYSLKGGVREWLSDVGMWGCTSHTKRVPERIFKGTKQNIRHFLAAYFSCDGSFSRATSGFEFYSVNKDLLKDVQHLLLRLGIVASLSLKNGRYKGERHISWRLRVPSMGFDEIRRWPIVLKRKRPPRTEEVHRFLPTISKIEENGEQETWSLQITTGYHYTNDILTHNTTLVSVILPILEICRDPNVRIAIIAKNDSEGTLIMQNIQAELSNNIDLIEDFGPFRPESDEDKPWAAGRMSVSKRTLIHKSPTIGVFGAGSRGVLGYRTDWTICVAEGTQVQTKSGPRAVERLTLSDSVLTHTGNYQKIYGIGTRMADNVLALHVNTQPIPEFITEEHPVLTPNGWIKAADIRVGDEIAAAIPKNEVEDDRDVDFWELVGWWLAEGGLESRYVRLTLGSHEREQAERLRNIGAKYGTSANTRERKQCNAIDVLIYGKNMIDFFREFDREGNSQKVIPGWVEQLPINKLREVVRGYLLGDGNKNGEGNGWRAVSVSLPLLQGIQRCLSRAGFWASICKNGLKIRERSRQKSYLILVGVEALEWLGLFKASTKDGKKRGWRIDNDGNIWLMVKSIEKSMPQQVYSIGVNEDHSFSAGSLMTHNCDDVVTEKNSSTQDQRNKLRQWFNQYASTTIEKHEEGRITVVGTRFDPADLYGDLIDLRFPDTGEKIWKVQHEDAIVDAEKKKPLWDKQWSWKALMEKKAELGTLDFNKRYRNIAVDASRMVFKEEYVKGGYIGSEKYPGCLDDNYRVGDFEDSWRRVAGFDPAIGVSRSTKFCAHITLAVGSCKDHERCFWVIDLEREQLALPMQVDMILGKHQEYGLDASIIEANSYQAGLYQAVKQKMDDSGLAMRIEPHYTSRTNKPDPEVGVSAMSVWFENGKVHIPYGDVHSRRKMEQFIDELVQYPGKTTDTVMAFWFAWKYLQESGPKYQSYNRLRKREWGKHMSRHRIQNPYYARETDDRS